MKLSRFTCSLLYKLEQLCCILLCVSSTYVGLATLLRDPDTQLLVEGHCYWGSVSVFLFLYQIHCIYVCVSLIVWRVAEGKVEVIGLKFMCVYASDEYFSYHIHSCAVEAAKCSLNDTHGGEMHVHVYTVAIKKSLPVCKVCILLPCGCSIP